MYELIVLYTSLQKVQPLNNTVIIARTPSLPWQCPRLRRLPPASLSSAWYIIVQPRRPRALACLLAPKLFLGFMLDIGVFRSDTM